MSDLLFGTGPGPLLTLVQTYYWLTFGFLLCAALAVFALLFPHLVADGDDFAGWSASGDGGD